MPTAPRRHRHVNRHCSPPGHRHSASPGRHARRPRRHAPDPSISVPGGWGTGSHCRSDPVESGRLRCRIRTIRHLCPTCADPAVARGVGSAGGVLRATVHPASGAHHMLTIVDRITVNPKQMGGVPCIRRLRIPVATVVGMVADGLTVEQIVAELPPLEPEDVRAALRYAAETVADRELPLRTTA